MATRKTKAKSVQPSKPPIQKPLPFTQPAAPIAKEPPPRTGFGAAVSVRSKLNGGDPLTAERLYDDEERIWLKAVADYKRRTRRQFPTNSELLAILKSLGYRLVATPTDLPIYDPLPVNQL